METRYFTCLTAVLFTWLFTGCAPTPKANGKSKISPATDDKVIADMREQGLSQSTPFYLTEINSRAMRDFADSYPDATEPKWVKYYGGFVVYFRREGIRYKVYYTKTGDHKCTIRQYPAQYLPPEIRQMIENTFRDYSIFLVNEVIKRGKTRYEIKIEDETSFKEIKIEEGIIKETHEYVKSK